MKRSISTAVIAAAEHFTQQTLVHLLSAANVELLFLANDPGSALEALEKHRPDLLVADLQLPGMDGSALVQHAACSFRLPVRPAAILLRQPASPVINWETLDASGVIILEKPVSADCFNRAIQGLRASTPVFSFGEIKRADALLEELGIPDHLGRNCLRSALLFAAADERLAHRLGSKLYPMVGEICGISPLQAERAMRHAIDIAWQGSQFENQYRIFADTIDAGRGQPTCGQMISRLADILRLEG